MRFKLIMALVNPDLTNEVIDYAKKAGATGDVIIPARGKGSSQAKFLGVELTDQTDIVLFVVEEHITQRVLNAITQECNLSEPGNGIAIVLGIERVAGLERQISQIKDKLREENL